MLFSQVLIILQNNAAQLLAASSFPVSLKNKAVYFIKREQGPVPKEEISQHIILGDMAVKPIEQLAALVDEASVSSRSCQKSWALWNYKQIKQAVLQCMIYDNSICHLTPE